MVGHFSIFPATSLSCQPLLKPPSHFSTFSFHPGPPSVSGFLRAHPSCLFSPALLTLTSLVSMTSSVLTSLKFILAVLDRSSLPQTPDISTWKSHKLSSSHTTYISVSVSWIWADIIVILSAAQAGPLRIFLTPCLWPADAQYKLQLQSVSFSSSVLIPTLSLQNRLPTFSGLSHSLHDHFCYYLFSKQFL